MPNENETKKAPEVAEQPQEVSPTVEDFIKEAKERVSQADYERAIAERDKAIADRNQVMQAVLDGESLSRSSEKVLTLEEARSNYNKVINKSNATNLEVAQAQVNLRKAILKAGGQDPAVPYNATAEDYAAANRVFDVKEQCILEADGDPKKFVYLWEQRIQPDDPSLIAALKKRSSKKK